MTSRPFADHVEPVAIYRHFDLNGELLYIGISSHPQLRWLQHLEHSPWARFVADISVHWIGDRRAAATAERRAIRRERPLFNRARPRGCPDVAQERDQYLRTGVSGLFRRVPCANEPGSFCISCGPDLDAWLDWSWQQYLKEKAC